MDSRQIRDILREECRLEGKRPLIVGVSGGADSLCLLSLLKTAGVPLVAAHFDHQLRPESARDERFVARMAESLKCFFVSGSTDVRSLAEREGLNLEAAARKARYGFLFSQARRLGAEAIAVGHTADDQVETILMHILRGTGLEGLQGMSYRSLLPSLAEEIPVVRPLLGFWRAETKAYCAENGLDPIEDQTNQDQTFVRNRLRLGLIPELQKYNPQIKRRLVSLGKLAQSSLSGSAEMADWVYKHCLMKESAGEYTVLSSADLSSLPDAWIGQVIRKAANRLEPENTDLDFRAIQRAIKLIRKPAQSGQVDIGAGNVLARVNERVYLLRKNIEIPVDEWPQIDSTSPVELKVPGVINIQNRWRIRAEILTGGIPRRVPATVWEAWLDRAAVGGKLFVRAWSKGDHFEPFGMAGNIKVSDFFTNQKIPQPARRAWPLIFAGDEVAWVTGLRISEKFRIKDDTNEILRLTLARAEDSGEDMGSI